LLEASGYHCTRSAGSLGAWDIVAIGSTDTVLVQCKTNRWPPPVEMAAMKLFPVPANCRKLVHRWDDRERMPLVKAMIQPRPGSDINEEMSKDEQYRRADDGTSEVFGGFEAEALPPG
jgi:hypothetical protein